MASCIKSVTLVDRLVRGVTLIELLVTLAVAAILAMIAAPGLHSTLAARAVSSTADDLAVALRQARSEALKRGLSVSVCASSDPNATGAVCANNAWVTGWLVFTDQNSNGDLGAGDQLIRAFTAGKSVSSITESGGQSFATFMPNGLLKGGTHLQWDVASKLSSDSPGYAAALRTVCLNLAGRAKIMMGQDQVCP
ncbi:GspH/FimT family pseudopilin [Ideonella azotifigens]|nr:GspH/FimT family pseudopilin [Ideonella azotifigens]MCD2342119.1 GspH/FimT family pseudopilin [Ideonella azotifigens]